MLEAIVSQNSSSITKFLAHGVLSSLGSVPTQLKSHLYTDACLWLRNVPVPCSPQALSAASELVPCAEYKVKTLRVSREQCVLVSTSGFVTRFLKGSLFTKTQRPVPMAGLDSCADSILSSTFKKRVFACSSAIIFMVYLSAFPLEC